MIVIPAQAGTRLLKFARVATPEMGSRLRGGDARFMGG